MNSVRNRRQESESAERQRAAYDAPLITSHAVAFDAGGSENTAVVLPRNHGAHILPVSSRPFINCNRKLIWARVPRWEGCLSLWTGIITSISCSPLCGRVRWDKCRINTTRSSFVMGDNLHGGTRTQACVQAASALFCLQFSPFCLCQRTVLFNHFQLM